MTTELLSQGSASLGIVLASTGAGVVIAQTTRRRPILPSVLAQRWLTWALLGPVWLAASVWGPARESLLTALAVVAMIEYCRLRPALVTVDRWLLVAWAAFGIALAALISVDPLVIAMAAVLSATIFPLASQDIINGPRRIGDMTVAVTLVLVPLLLLREIAVEGSGALFFTIGLSIAFSDVTAFAIGSAFGRRRFVPILSPNKTVAGLFGNVVGAGIGIAIAASAGIVDLSTLWMTPVVALVAVVGDLLVSLIKRSRGVKDAGAWLPGFGGLLDRIDSLLVAVPLIYLVLATTGIAT